MKDRDLMFNLLNMLIDLNIGYKPIDHARLMGMKSSDLLIEIHDYVTNYCKEHFNVHINR